MNGCVMTATFTFEPGTDSKTFHVTGYLSVKDMTGKFEDYPILVEGTVTTNFFRTDWSAEWDLSYQDPVYETQSYSETSTPAASVNQFRNRLTSFNGEYIEPHIPSESGGFTEGSGHVEVTVNLEAVNDSKMNASISVLSFSDSARIAEVSASGEVELQPAITIAFEDDGWGNKGILHLLFLENGEIGIWSEITEYDEYANWELYIEYVELAMTSSGSDYNDNRLPTLAIDTSYPFGYYEKDGGGAIDIGYTTDEPSSIYFRFYKDRDESMYGNYWADQEPDYTTYFDWFDAGSYKTWSLIMDATSVQVEISEEYIVVTTDGPLGPLSADQASGIYYCKAQSIDP